MSHTAALPVYTKDILAIDPGCDKSAWVLISSGYRPKSFDICDNNQMLYILSSNRVIPLLVIEMIASYGMPVGAEVFETCVWIGRFMEAHKRCGGDVSHRIYRKEVKLNLCGQTKAKDANIRQALMDRFGDKGTKANPGWFYGFKADIWAAYAVGVTLLDQWQLNHNRFWKQAGVIKK